MDFESLYTDSIVDCMWASLFYEFVQFHHGGQSCIVAAVPVIWLVKGREEGVICCDFKCTWQKKKELK